MPSAVLMLKVWGLFQLVPTANQTMPEVVNRLRTNPESLADVLIDLDPDADKSFVLNMPAEQQRQVSVALVRCADLEKMIFPAFHNGTEWDVKSDDIGEYEMLTVWAPPILDTPETEATKALG